MTLFLDEPTSGLDSTAALAIGKLLRDIASLGITIVSVIHQPRAEIFECFDDILMLAPGGITAYLGPQKSIIPYFSKLGFHFPINANSADVLMDILSGKGEKADKSAYTVESLTRHWQEISLNRSDGVKPATTAEGTAMNKVIRRICAERGGGFFYQTWLCHTRSLIQQKHKLTSLALELSVAGLCGTSLSVLFSVSLDSVYM